MAKTLHELTTELLATSRRLEKIAAELAHTGSSGTYARVPAPPTWDDVETALHAAGEAMGAAPRGGYKPLWSDLYDLAGVPEQFRRKELTRYWAEQDSKRIEKLLKAVQLMADKRKVG